MTGCRGGCRLLQCAIELTTLLPQLTAVQVEGVAAGEELVRITARTHTGVPAVCPGCGQASGWEHSRYVRHVADGAVGSRPVVIVLSVRRLYCENPDCAKRTFAQQVEGLTVRYQRRTPALQAVVDAVACALAGKAGARLLLHLHQVLSWATMLNYLLRVALPRQTVPRVLGIDEFALRSAKSSTASTLSLGSGESGTCIRNCSQSLEVAEQAAPTSPTFLTSIDKMDIASRKEDQGPVPYLTCTNTRARFEQVTHRIRPVSM